MEERIEYLPIFIDGIDNQDYDQEFTIDKIKDIEKVKKFYTDLGIEIIGIEHFHPTLGFKHDELTGRFPKGWYREGAGGPWVDVFNENGEQMFSMFIKKAPWEYVFFARK